MNYNEAKDIILSELSSTLNLVSKKEVKSLIDSINKSKKIFFVGVGRVKLSLEAIAKRWSHIGYKVFIVGQITEPAISKDDILIVGSGSGESIYPLQIAKKAKEFGATVVHIGSNKYSSMREYSDLFIRIPVQTKLYLGDEIKSKQPMTSLFEQSLLIIGDIISMMIVSNKEVDMDNLWKYHANLE